MVETSFNLFDAIVLGMVFLSTVLSFFRGFGRELLSLGSWIGAMAITILYTPEFAVMIQDDVDKGQSAALLVASVVLFFAAKIGFALLNMLLFRYLKPSKDVGLIDNFLGLGFGFARAALLVSLGYYVYSFVASEENQPEWIAQSMTRPYVAQGSKLIEPYLKDFVEQIAPAVKERAEQFQPGAAEQINSLSDEDKAALKDKLESVDPEDLQRIIDQMKRPQSPASESR